MTSIQRASKFVRLCHNYYTRTVMFIVVLLLQWVLAMEDLGCFLIKTGVLQCAKAREKFKCKTRKIPLPIPSRRGPCHSTWPAGNTAQIDMGAMPSHLLWFPSHRCQRHGCWMCRNRLLTFGVDSSMSIGDRVRNAKGFSLSFLVFWLISRPFHFFVRASTCVPTCACAQRRMSASFSSLSAQQKVAHWLVRTRLSPVGWSQIDED
jgi:hypothetical protein